MARTSLVGQRASRNFRAVSRTITSSSLSVVSIIFPPRPASLPWHVQTAAADLVTHDLGAAVVDAGLEGALQVVRENAALDRVRRAVQKLAVWAEHLGDRFRRAHAVFRRPGFFGGTFVGEIAAVLDDRHAAHGHQPAA